MSTYHQNQNAAEHGTLLARCEAAEAERDRLRADRNVLVMRLRDLKRDLNTLLAEVDP